MNKLISIILVSMIILTTGCSNTNTEEILSYLEKNNSIVNLVEKHDLEGLNLLKDKIENKKIILSGGLSGLRKDDLLNLKLIKYLQKEIGLNYYLAEVSYSEAYFLKKYLESGDEAILNKAFINMKDTPNYNVDYYDFYKNLYKFNETLSDKDKIQIIGIDIEKNLVSSAEYIKDIVKDEAIDNPKIEELLNSIDKLNSYIKTRTPENEDKDLERELFNSLNSKVDLLKEDLFSLNIVLDNLKTYCLSESKKGIDVNEAIKLTEDQIYENFRIQDEKIDNGVYFGQLSEHRINKSRIKEHGDFDSIAAKINNSKKYKDKVISMLYSYDGWIGSGILNRGFFNRYLNSANDCTVFDLGNTNSPFKDQLLPIYEDDKIYDKKKPITDYIDYLIIVETHGITESQELELN